MARAPALAAVLGAAGAGAGHIGYGFPAGTPLLQEYSATFVWTVGPPDNVYGAMQFWFEGSGGYFGSQFHPTGQSLLFSVWDASPTSGMPDTKNTAMPLGDCGRFGGEGVGAQCSIQYPIEVGKAYTLRLFKDLVQDIAGGVKWTTTVTANATGATTPLGSILLKDVSPRKGFGDITASAASFIEYYGGGEFHSAYGWIGPFGDGGRYVVETANSDYEAEVKATGAIPGFGSGAPYSHYERGPGVAATPAGALWGAAPPTPPAPPRTPRPAPACRFAHTANAYEEPVPSNNIRCDAALSLADLEAACCADPNCASFSKGAQGGCLKRCAAQTKWVNATGNDGYHKVGSCDGRAAGSA